MAKSRTRIALLVILTFACFALAVPPPPASASHTTCTKTTDQPHYSSPAAGIIVKGKILCTGSGINAKLEVMLYLCPSQPQQTESYIQSNCTLKGYGSDYFTPVPINKTKAAYAPPTGQPGAHGSGWWIGCTIFDLVQSGDVTHYVYTIVGPPWQGAG